MMVMKKRQWIPQCFLWGSIVVCTIVLISLCFNEGIDYDEAYSYWTVTSNTVPGIWESIIEAHDTDIPLWYSLLRVWTYIFGESIFACKMLSVLGNIASMTLGATIIRRNWGNRTAFLFIILTGISPALMYNGINIRMYPWTTFLVTASALTAYHLAQKPEKKGLWVLLSGLSVAGLFCHYFTAFCYLFIYLYLFIELIRQHRKGIRELFVSGIVAVIPFFVWLYVSDFFHLKKSGEESQIGLSKVDIPGMLDYLFRTRISYSILMGVIVLAVTILGFVLLRKRYKKEDWSFTLLTLSLFFVTYFMAGIMASVSSHFFVTRHVMHSIALLWLGMAIVLPRINLPTYISGVVFAITMCSSYYDICYDIEYTTTPYIEETKAFIAENMEPGDIVIHNSEAKFATLFACYMPEQEFFQVSEITDIQEFAGKRVWFFLCNPNFFSPEEQEKYGITYENMGHYGFQIIGDCTDFDLLKLDIHGAGK